MTTPLISPGLITRLRTVANRGLQTPVTILSRMPVTENPYGDDTESWVTMGDFDGWIRGVGTARLEDTTGNVVAAIGVYRLHLRAEVELNPGDMVVCNDEEFIVQDENHENTYRVFTTAMLRRKQP